MIYKSLACVLFLFLVLTASVSAQDDDMQSAVDYKLSKMKISLKLTDSQIAAIKPIIKDYLTKRNTYLQEMTNKGIIDHVAVKGSLKELKEDEHQKLSRILTEDQMKAWIDKENLMAALNPDGSGIATDDGPTLTSEGANFKF